VHDATLIFYLQELEEIYKIWINSSTSILLLSSTESTLIYILLYLPQPSSIFSSASTASSSTSTTMGISSELDSPKTDALHVEKVSTSSLGGGSEHLEDLDSIEQTQSGRYAWLVAITAGVGGLLFGMYTRLSRSNIGLIVS
jgi:hypothetical protein